MPYIIAGIGLLLLVSLVVFLNHEEATSGANGDVSSRGNEKEAAREFISHLNELELNSLILRFRLC